ncbi:MAG: protein-(glutamine-N5) methyltransferase, release factor-specific [Porticoccaceae bacterium]|nr:protein-(glutamine-N5) methyltransferase, release factor-specific [Porticoccaceae bacterium]
MKSNELLKQSIKFLKSYSKETPELDSKMILGFVLDLKNKIYLHDDVNVSEKKLIKFKKLLNLRANGKPVSRIIGKKYFWKDVFNINDWTLDPRPDSEILIEEVLLYYHNKEKNFKILDLGCGSGCLGLSLLGEFPNAMLIGVDQCKKALAQAKKNSKELFCNHRSNFLNVNWFNKNWTKDILQNSNFKTKFDIIICNPPYIKKKQINNLQEEVKYFDPVLALDGGKDGCDSYRAILNKVSHLISNEGIIAIEISDEILLKVKNIILKQGLNVKKIVQDYSGNNRVLIIK